MCVHVSVCVPVFVCVCGGGVSVRVCGCARARVLALCDHEAFAVRGRMKDEQKPTKIIIHNVCTAHNYPAQPQSALQ